MKLGQIGVIGSSGLDNVDSQYPLIFGSNARWINGRTTAGKTLTGPFSQRVDSLTTNDSNALSFTSITGITNRMRHSSKWLHSPGIQGYECTDKASWKFSHDGTNWDYFRRVRVYEHSNTSLFPFCSSNNGTATQIGVHITYDNRSASSRTRALTCFITNGTSAVFNRVANNAIPLNTWCTIRIKFRSTSSTSHTITMYVDEVQVDTANSVVAINTADSTGNFVLNKFSTTNTYGKFLSKQELWVVGGTSDAESTAVHDYFEEGNESIYSDVGWSPSRTVRLHLMWGQSNMDNGALGPPVDLQGPLGAAIFANRDAVGALEELDYEVNNTRTLGESAFGPELQYGKLLYADLPGTNLIYKYAVGGSSMNTSWNTSLTGNEQENFRLFMNTKLRDQLRWSLDASVIVARINGSQGEADAHTDNPYAPDTTAIQTNYTNQFTALMNAFISDCNTNGWDTTNTEIVMSELTFGAAELVNRPYRNEINAAIAAVADRVVETSDLSFSDDVHYNSASTVIRGTRFYTP